MQKEPPPVWRLWVDTQEKIVSFHPVEGYELMEFHDAALFFRCIDIYTHQHYRYQ